MLYIAPYEGLIILLVFLFITVGPVLAAWIAIRVRRLRQRLKSTGGEPQSDDEEKGPVGWIVKKLHRWFDGAA